MSTSLSTIGSKQVFILVSLSILTLCCGIEFTTKPILISKLALNQSAQYSLPPSSKKSVLVLFWTGCYGGKGSWNIWFPDSIKQKMCPNLPCYYTEDKSLVKLADAVVFHGFYSIDPKKNYTQNFPPHRNPNQRWVFVTSEVPTPNNFTSFDGIFNWTMTYRRDSSVYMNYGRLILRENPARNDTNKNYALGRTKMAAMFNSHCSTSSKRELYVKELQKYMDVDVFGKCGPMKCGGRFQLQECITMLNKYKFFLSFENSLCKDYVTEKLTKILALSNVVPITYGGAEYNLFFPNTSYVNALSFDSPKALADYIKIIDQNDTLYNQYFDWKRGYDVEFVRDFSCDFCHKLLDPSLPRQTIDKFHDWWVRDSQCVDVKAISKNQTKLCTK